MVATVIRIARMGQAWLARALAAVILLACTTVPVSAQEPETGINRAVKVLLTFDVETPEDATALRQLGISLPATYFITGAFAEKNQALVTELAAQGTIGSHSYGHPHLTTLSPDQLRRELMLGKLVLERITGRDVEWFRAPFLEYNEAVSSTLADIGFRYDSSDFERWTRNDRLRGVPIASLGALNASDAEIFDQQGLSDADALDLLKQAFIARSGSGRPLVLLLHPRIIVRHAAVLDDFIEFAASRGAIFMSAEEYIAQMATHVPARRAVWVDFSLGDHDPAQIVRDVHAADMTDVYLMAQDPSGNPYFGKTGTAERGRDLFGETAALLKRAGVRVHAWFPVFSNARMAQLHPSWAAVAQNGTRDLLWLSPSHPDVLRYVTSQIDALLEGYPLDGIHLDYLRFASLDFDYSQHAIDAFTTAQGLKKTPSIAELLNAHYRLWVDWRSQQVTKFTGEISHHLRQAGNDQIELSAALIGEAARHYRAQEKFGQDYSALAAHLDTVLAMVYFKLDKKPVTWIADTLFLARQRIGETRMFAGLMAYQNASDWTLDAELFRRSIDASGSYADGRSFYPYLYLFGRGAPSRNLPAAGLDFLTANAAVSEQPTVGLWGGLEDRLPWVAVMGLVSVLLVAAAVARRSRSRDGTSVGASATQEAGRAKIGARWRALAARLDTEHKIDGMICANVAALLQSLGPIGVERLRYIYLLEQIAVRGGTVDNVSDLVQGRTPWHQSAFRHVHEAVLLDLIRFDGNSIVLTEHGQAELDAARAEGIDAEFCEFVEQRLAERLTVQCPRCKTMNLTDFYWQEVDCKGCGRPITVVTLAKVGRLTPETASPRPSLAS